MAQSVEPSTKKSAYELMVEALTPHLGAFTANSAVRTFAQRSLGLDPVALGYTDALKLLDALRPTLAALAGSAAAAQIISSLTVRLKG